MADNPADGRECDGDDDGEAPWDEDKWEAFMRESDLRSARFGEILETVMDDPDRDRIVAREMGWTWLTEALEERDAARAAGELDEEGEAEAETEGIETERAAPRAADEDAFDDEDDCDSIPAYRLANEVGLRVHEALRPYMRGEADGTDEEFARRLGQASIGCTIAAAKISGGHAMGYEDDVLCGNIANCKRGLAGARESEQALLELKEEGALPPELVDALLPDVRAVIRAVEARVEELRAKVWW